MQLAATATQRGLLRSRVLTDEGEQLVAQVDALLNTNSVVMHRNPVREFLLTQPKVEVTVAVEAKSKKQRKKQKFDTEASAEAASTALKPNQGETPIFQQN